MFITFLEECARLERRGLEDGIVFGESVGTGEGGGLGVGLGDGELTSTTSYTLEVVSWNGTSEDGDDTDGDSTGSLSEGSP